MTLLPQQVESRDATGRKLDAAMAETRVLLPQRRDERVTTRGYYFAVYRYQDQELDDLPRAAFLAALEAEGVPCAPAYGLPVYRYQAFAPDALQQSPLRGLSGVPRYDQLYLPVTERLCAREQITIPHPILLTGDQGVRMVADSVAKIIDHRDDLRRWWRAQQDVTSGAAQTV
jgi:hypothetical protein